MGLPEFRGLQNRQIRSLWDAEKIRVSNPRSESQWGVFRPRPPVYLREADAMTYDITGPDALASSRSAAGAHAGRVRRRGGWLSGSRRLVQWRASRKGCKGHAQASPAHPIR